MRLLAESSAVLAWLLNEPAAPQVGALFLQAELILTSNLTWIECERVLHRLAALGERPQEEIVDSQTRLQHAAVGWTSVELTSECQQRARQPFPLEPVRTLDALHLATAVVARDWIPDLHFLTFDHRIRANATALGFQVIP